MFPVVSDNSLEAALAEINGKTRSPVFFPLNITKVDGIGCDFTEDGKDGGLRAVDQIPALNHERFKLFFDFLAQPGG